MSLELVSLISRDRTRSHNKMSHDQLAIIVYRSLKGRRFQFIIDEIWRISLNDNNKSRIMLITRFNYVVDYAIPDFLLIIYLF